MPNFQINFIVVFFTTLARIFQESKKLNLQSQIFSQIPAVTKLEVLFLTPTFFPYMFELTKSLVEGVPLIMSSMYNGIYNSVKIKIHQNIHYNGRYSNNSEMNMQ